jgi:hypothetical protein
MVCFGALFWNVPGQNLQKTLVRIMGVPAAVRKGHLPNTGQACYLCFHDDCVQFQGDLYF